MVFDFETNAPNYSVRVRVTDEQNASLEKPFVISLLNEIEDLDGDGIEDFYDADDDNDGFSDAEEIAYGSDPRDAGSVANAAPSSLDLNGSGILENQPISALVGLLQGIDPDANASLSYSLVDGNGSIDNSLFILDGNGTLSSAVVFDFETNASNYSVRVRVTDEHNASLEKIFIISLLNEIEDLDGDGIEDFYDADDDGDGFSDAEESVFGSDPRDAGSVANAAPSDLDLNGSGILENQPIDAVVGLLQGIDSDANASLSYSLVDGNGSLDNALFSLDLNGLLSSAVVFDYENNQSNYSIRVKVIDEHNASLEKAFVISLLNVIEDLDGDGIEDFYDPDDDGDGFSDAEEIAYGSDPRDANSVADTLPIDLTLSGLTVMENQPIGTIVGHFAVIDPDPKDTHTVRFNDLNANGSHNHLFTIDANHTLRTAVVFDFENNASAMSLRAKVKQNQTAVFWKFFTINLLNQIEDLDGDGIEDFYDPDDDNDGFSDANEIAYGSDPRDVNSVANAVPSSLDLNGSTILENQPIGTIIGNLYALDHDLNASLSFYLSQNFKDNSLFLLETNGTLRSARIFDYENNQTHTIQAMVVDEHNASATSILTVEILDQMETLTPIVSTKKTEASQRGEVLLQGEIIYDGGGSIFESGFLLSEELSVEFGDQKVTRVLSKTNNANFFKLLVENPFSGNFYYRSYALNEAGLGLGSIKQVKILVQEPTWWGSIISSQGDWKASNWFGSFMVTKAGWIYHERLGWAYASATPDDGVWLWSALWGWSWTKEKTFPYHYCWQSSSWKYWIFYDKASFFTLDSSTLGYE